MRKFILITLIAVTGLFADAMTDMASKAVSSEVKDKATSSMTDQIKDQAMSKAKEQATDVAAEEAEKAVGKETLTKETAKSTIKSVL
jgi:choline-glycine betaine transporter